MLSNFGVRRLVGALDYGSFQFH